MADGQNNADDGGSDGHSIKLSVTAPQEAFTPEQQAHEARSTARLLASSGVRIASLEVDVKNIATGRIVPRDDPSILQRPQAHEMTLVVDGRFYTFRPLSRASLEAFTGR